MTLWGESLPVIAAAGVTVADIQKRAGSAALSGTWDLWFSDSATWAGPGDPVTLSWVVEVTSGSGSITASDGKGASGSVPSLAALGTFAAAPGQVVIPSTLTVADLFGWPVLPFLRLAGSGLVVQQVKLRVWPDPLPGGWSAPYQHEGSLRPPSIVFGNSTASSTSVGPDGTTVLTAQEALTLAQEGQRTAIAASDVVMVDEVPFPTSPVAVEAIFQALGNQEKAFPTNFNGFAQAGIGAAFYKVTGSPIGNYEPPGVYGVDWAFPPDEVSVEDVAMYDVVGDPNAGTLEWDQGVITLAPQPLPPEDLPPTEPFSVSLSITTATPPDVSDVAGSALSMMTGATRTCPGSGPAEQATLPALIPTATAVRIAVWHPGALTEQASAYNLDDASFYYEYAGGSRVEVISGRYVGEVFEPVRYRYRPPPFRYWSAAPARAPYLRQRNRDTIRAKNLASRQRGLRARGYL